MELKTSLEMYRTEKSEMKENCYGYSRGSALLFEARAGCLRTKRIVGKCAQKNGLCIVCGNATEMIRHIGFEWERIYPIYMR